MNSNVRSKRKTVKVKDEKQEQPSQSGEPEEEKDLTFYIKDRVELMRQVFSIMRDRELLAMAPDCIRELGIGGIQEILLDEVLGISSKRLNSILDGYPCPSDTESSDESVNNPLETISLDSISSDDDILAQQDPQSKKKHLKKRVSNKDSKKKNKVGQNSNNKDDSKIKKHRKEKTGSKEANKKNPEEENASGMTVLELLELQARARAIRAQLAAVEIRNTSNEEEDKNNRSHTTSVSDADEVVIKEEPPDIVEIHSSSDDGENSKTNEKKKSDVNEETSNDNVSSTQNSIAKDLPRKIKLNRTNLLVSITNSPPKSNSEELASSSSKTTDNESVKKSSKMITSASSTSKTVVKELVVVKNKSSESNASKHTSDHNKQLSDDEIMLELSDSEKFDVLESLHSPKPAEERVIKPIINRVEPKTDDEHILTIEDLRETDDKIVEKNILSDEDYELVLITSPKMQNTKEDCVISDGECSTGSIMNDNPAQRQFRKRKHSESDKNSTKSSDIIQIDAITEINEKIELKIDNLMVDTDVSQSKDTEDSIFEISDDSDDETSNVLSKEPTREEIEELSRKIDSEIDRDSLNILENHLSIDLKIKGGVVEDKKVEEVSWKSRWLESSKVKKVMATSNLCNALRKKNKELKKKLENKSVEAVAAENIVALEPETISKKPSKEESFEGSVSHYQTLPPSTKYTTPVNEPDEKASNEESMKADAKQLMKMYKKLLKINNAEEGLNKAVKVKKHKKDKKKDKKEKKKKKADKVKKVTEAEETVAVEKVTKNNTAANVDENKI